MRSATRIVLALLLATAARSETPLLYGFMPKCLDVDSVVHITPRDTSDVVDSTYNDFPSIALPDSGVFVSYSGDTLVLPPGVLFSERKAALYVYFRSAWERQAEELYYMRYLVSTYCDKSRQAEVLYQGEIERLRKEAKRNWLERNAGYIGFGAALLVMAVRDYAVVDIIGGK